MQAQAQADMQKSQMEMQADAAKTQAQMQLEQAKMQQEAALEQQRQQFEMQIKTQELQQKEQMERFKAELDAATKIMVARIAANPGLDIPLLEAQQATTERVVQDMGAEVKAAMDRLGALYENLANAQTEGMNGIRSALTTLTAPKRIIRGPDGRAVGVEAVQQTLEFAPEMRPQ